MTNLTTSQATLTYSAHSHRCLSLLKLIQFYPTHSHFISDQHSFTNHNRSYLIHKKHCHSSNSYKTLLTTFYLTKHTPSHLEHNNTHQHTVYLTYPLNLTYWGGVHLGIFSTSIVINLFRSYCSSRHSFIAYHIRFCQPYDIVSHAYLAQLVTSSTF